MTVTETSFGDGKYAIRLEVHTTGGYGLAAFLTGGERPHMGGVSLVSPRILRSGKDRPGVDKWTITVPGHRDAELAEKIAKKLCQATGEAVSVSAGVHIDGAAREEIELLSDNALRAADLFLEAYSGRPGAR